MSARTKWGMTLLEVTVALAVAGTALAAGASVLGFLTDQQNRSGAHRLATANAVRTTIRSWSSAIRVATEGDAEFRGDAHELTFVTSAPTRIAPAGADAGTRVRIYLERADSAAIRGLVAEFTPWRRLGPPVVVSLAPDATGFEAKYLASLFGLRSWQASWVSSSVLPAAMELRVTFDSAHTTSGDIRAAHALLSLPITIALGGRR